MRIGDLAKTTGVPVATLKFYLREGLLPAGTPTAVLMETLFLAVEKALEERGLRTRPSTTTCTSAA